MQAAEVIERAGVADMVLVLGVPLGRERRDDVVGVEVRTVLELDTRMEASYIRARWTRVEFCG